MIHTQTAGGVVVGPTGEVLVVNQNNKSWSLPKGHLESGETNLQAAVREIREESGVTELELVKKLGSYNRHLIGKEGGDDSSELKTLHFFLFRTTQTELMPEDPENPEARWVKPSQVATLLTHLKDKQFFESILDEVKLLLPK